MSLPCGYNPIVEDSAMMPTGIGLMPLRFLVRQAGMAGFLLLLLEPLGFLVIRGRTEGYDGVDSSAMIQILYAVICFIYSASYFTLPRNRGASRLLVTSPLVFLLLYTVLCGISTLWSPKPLYTAFMAFQCLALLLLIVAVFSELNWRCSSQDMIEWAMLWIVWTILWSVALNIRWHGMGYLLYPFGAARLSTGVFFFLAFYLCRRRLFGWIVVAFTILSISNKNYFGILPGALLACVLGDKKSRVLALLVGGTLVFSILCFGMEEVIQNTLFYGKEGVGWEYMTGRDKVFSFAWEWSLKRPWTGYGFAAGEREILLSNFPGAISMHNMLLSAFFGVGVLGPVLLILYFVMTMRSCLSRSIPSLQRFAFTATVFMVFVISMTAPGLGSRVYGSWLASVVVMAAITVLTQATHSQYAPTVNRYLAEQGFPGNTTQTT